MPSDVLFRRLRGLVSECQLAATSFSDEQIAEGLAITDELRACFLPPPASASSAVAQTAQLQQAESADLLQLLPSVLLSVILSHLDARDLARLAATCPSLWRDAPTPPTHTRIIGPVEVELRRRAEARGLVVISSLPEGAPSWVPYLLASDRRDELRRLAPLAVGFTHSIFIDSEGRLLTCGREDVGELILGHAVDPEALLLGHAVDPEADPDAIRATGLPTLMPSMQDRRIVSVASSGVHCLALSAEGEVYSWGRGDFGVLGHPDQRARGVPSRIESLSRIECIAAGPHWTSAAVDGTGDIYTWGCAFVASQWGLQLGPTGLGYEVDPERECQPTPRRVDSLSQSRVVGAALGECFTLAVTDAGAVFSFGYSQEGALGHLGHALSKREVLPRRIDALAQTGWRFVAVATGDFHALRYPRRANSMDGAIGWIRTLFSACRTELSS